MKILKILLTLNFLLILSSCGFSKLNNELAKFNINTIDINGNKRYANVLKNKIMLNSNKSSEKVYDIEIDLFDIKESKIKNTTGKTTRYNLKLNANVKIIDHNKNIFIRSFDASTDYEVSNDHSDTIRNESNSAQNNIDKISDAIAKYLQLINLN